MTTGANSVFNSQNNTCTKLCMHTHTFADARGGDLYSHCSSYSQSCKIQLYPVTWDHLQEMKSITKESKNEGRKREGCQRGIFSDTTMSVKEKGNSVWQYKWERQRQFHLNSLQVEEEYSENWITQSAIRHNAYLILFLLQPFYRKSLWDRITQVISKALATNMKRRFGNSDQTTNKCAGR